MVLLQLSNLSLSVGSTLLLEGVNALLTQGQRVALVGANGSGKSTLLRALTRPHNTYYLVGSGSITGTLGSATRGLDDDDNCADDPVGGAGCSSGVAASALPSLRPVRYL
jgi:ATPase subunit of ABC transporter with duplicated ATPase domains